MKTALGIGRFPIELTLNSNSVKPIPTIEFDKNPKTTGNLFNEQIKTYVTPTDYFKTKFREIFTGINLEKNRRNGWLHLILVIGRNS